MALSMACSSGGESANLANTSTDNEAQNADVQGSTETTSDETTATSNLSNPYNYANQLVPSYITKDNTTNNGIIDVAQNRLATDTSNTRSPSLRDVFRSDGTENGPFMHSGTLGTMNDVLDHYNDITVDRNLNPNIDNRLTGNIRGGNGPGKNNAAGQKLMLVESERAAVIAFLKTLSGNALYTNPHWADPFDAQGNLQDVLSQQ